MGSRCVCWVEHCSAARDLEGKVKEVNAMIGVVHLENMNRQRGRIRHQISLERLLHSRGNMIFTKV